jgi:hypothetical protein
MREHRVLRRALIVYVTAAVKIRIDPSMVPTHLLQRTAILFRVFGENYHQAGRDSLDWSHASNS